MDIINKKNTIFNLAKLSQYRTQLMGIAAIMIVLCHTAQYGVKMPGLLRKFVIYGNLGVDIFLLLSGIGCYYSLSKNTNLRNWYKKRFHRIFIPYLLIQFPFWVYYYMNGEFHVLKELYIFSTIAFWTDHVGAWYVALLIPLYIITPFIYKFSNNKFIMYIIIGIVLVACSIDIKVSNEIIEKIIVNFQWAFSRIPSFIIGIIIAPFVRKEYSISLINVIFLFSFSLLLFVFIHYFISDRVFMFWCLTLPITILISILIDCLYNYPFIYKFITWMGVISLESYLANIYLCKLFKKFYYSLEQNGLFYGHYIEYIFIGIIGILLASLINKLSQKFI